MLKYLLPVDILPITFMLEILVIFLYSIFIFIFANHFCGKKGFFYIWILYWIFTFFFIFFIFYRIIYCNEIAEFVWLTLSIPNLLPIIEFGFILDELSVKMICLIFFISFCVQGFSLVYMKISQYQIYFMIVLHMFTGFMILFVISPNLIQSFFAWEGLGFVSFVLINFWNVRDEANKAALKAFFFNRLADIWFMLVILLCLLHYKTTDFTILNSIAYCHNINYIKYIFIPFFGNIELINIIALSLFLASIGKSAQIGYHVWLLAAMEGPSPVSALLHSATMVTAGVYLLIRCAGIFQNCTPLILIFIICIGITTCFFCAWFAVIALDFKRLVAYSTCSHLGFMFTILGFNFFEVVELHLHVHAFFKTTVFLCAGLVMALFCHLQNFKKIASFVILFPICSSLLIFSNFNLAGIPFTIGSIAKERFIMLSFININSVFIINLYMFVTILALITSILYIIRLFLNIFFQAGFNGERRFLFFINYEFFGIFLSQIILCFGISFLYYIFIKASIQNLIVLFPWTWNFSFFITIFTSIVPKYVIFFSFFLLFIIICGYKIFQFFNYKKYFTINIFLFFKNYIIIIFNNFEQYLANIYYKLLKFYLYLSYKLLTILDRGYFEVYGPIGIIRCFNILIKFISSFQSGFILNNIYDIFFGCFTFICILLFFFIIKYQIYNILLIIFYLIILSLFIYFKHKK